MTVDTHRGAVSRRRKPAGWLREGALVVGVLSVFVIYEGPQLGQPLLDKHGFRQTQTAYQARIFHEEGIDLAHPQVPVLGVPFEIPFEFPLFQAGASLVMDLGVDDDMAMRLTGLLSFVVTALLLYGLVRHVAGRASAFGALVAFTLSPFALAWSRASMIEYLATAGAVGFTWSLIVWREHRRPLPGALALAAGLVGMLVKPTTAIFWIVPALAYRPTAAASSPSRRLRVHPWTMLAVVLPIAAAVLWTRHADAVKAASRTTEWLGSSELKEWNLGTLGQRLDLGVWETIGTRAEDYIIGLYVLFLPFVVLAVARSRQRPFWLGITLAAFLPPIIFTNLYNAHDYYLAAVSPAVAALVGLGAGFVWNLLPKRALVVASALAAGVSLVLGSLYVDRGYWVKIHGTESDERALPFAEEIKAHTKSQDRVAIVGLDWSPAVLYYARRRGHMVPPANEPFAYDLIHDQGYRYLLVADPSNTDLGFLSKWKWVGGLGPHTYALADSPTQLPKSAIVATDDTRAVNALTTAGGGLIGREIRLPCGQPVRVPRGAKGTWIRFAKPERNARVTISENLAPLPARSAVFVAGELAAEGKRFAISCTGAEALAIVGVIDAGRVR